MNIMLMTVLYPNSEKTEAAANSKGNMQYQADKFQHMIVDAFVSNGNEVTVINARPVGVFPRYYKKMILKQNNYDNIYNTGALNLPWFKQRTREKRAYKMLCQWASKSPDNRTILLYSLYLPFEKALVKFKNKFKDAKVVLIIGDLPNEYGLQSYRKGLMKKIEYHMGKKMLDLCSNFNGFVLLTEHIYERLSVSNKPFTIVEGLIDEKRIEISHTQIDECMVKYNIPNNKPFVLYTGTINKELGIELLIDAFEDNQLKNVNLVLCGKGDCETKLRNLKSNNIIYAGLIKPEEALALQQKADILINPRKPDAQFTKYSFPSKTMEYMQSGKPVLCFMLQGIPKEYKQYLNIIENPDSVGISSAICSILNNYELATEKSKKAKEFVENEKTSIKQVKKIEELLKSL